MQNIVNAIRDSLHNRNFYAAIFLSLSLPDICVALRDGRTTGAQYSAWFDEHLSQYDGFLSGDDCYALRCSVLHQGISDISDQRIRKALDQFIFLTSGSHLTLMRGNSVKGEAIPDTLQLNIQRFCEDICIAVEAWLVANSGNEDIQQRLNETLQIHEPGYVFRGFIRFG